MAKVSYANLKLKVNTDKKTFTFNDQEIEVLKYLPAKDKYDLISITLQKAKVGDLYNEFLLDVYFSLHLVYIYTNLSFTAKQREDEFKLYDTLKSNGFFDKFFETIEESEYNELIQNLEKSKQEYLTYSMTAASVIKKILVDLPSAATDTKQILDQINPETMELVYKVAHETGINLNNQAK